ncbi:uncharacterized protein EDB93DRAFT_435187 [Suillus bovinus]|uniref:uncharacterized protein n=1 Tax=Suillus bovinus TaxID=48563 RepID=UPI001B868FB8|nr:uncharacterized protein EDB93DRAFT_435187 [Suillus bovinus]KAG2158978.1 hypothetical protein EDB93DRAFT_435187 [Suillus bovinus]
MTINNPTQLIDEFKKSGEFDRLRRDLLSHFQHSDRTEAFKSRVDDIARQRLSSDPKLISMPNDAIQRELLGEIDRFVRLLPLADAPLLSDPSFLAGITASLERTMSAGKNEKNNATPSQTTPNLQPCDSGNPDFSTTNNALTPSAVQKE